MENTPFLPVDARDERHPSVPRLGCDICLVLNEQRCLDSSRQRNRDDVPRQREQAAIKQVAADASRLQRPRHSGESRVEPIETQQHNRLSARQWDGPQSRLREQTKGPLGTDKQFRQIDVIRS
jgi:hypothetical protein